MNFQSTYAQTSDKKLRVKFQTGSLAVLFFKILSCCLKSEKQAPAYFLAKSDATVKGPVHEQMISNDSFRTNSLTKYIDLDYLI